MNPWVVSIWVYLGLAILTFVPVILMLTKGVKLHPSSPSFDGCAHFSDEEKKRLNSHYSRLLGTLGFWKKQAEVYRYLHYYSLCWTIPASVIVPFLVQSINQDPYSKWLVTCISAHAAIFLAFHRALKVDSNYKVFRSGESEFYDLYRRLLDRPNLFGRNGNEQIESYFEEVEKIRKLIRNAETDNFPTLENVKSPVDKTVE